jgi:Clp amino terminal domain, pathogenicity island component
MYSRFDTEARIAVAQATDLARELGHSQVGPDHLLLGLLANMRGSAYAALTDHGVRLDAAREIVVSQHTDVVDADDATDPAADDDRPAGLDEDRAALRAIGIDLDRVRDAVRENLGTELTDGWGSRPERRQRGKGLDERSERGERRRRRGHGQRGGHHHRDASERGDAGEGGRGRRGPRSRRFDGLTFSAGLRDVLRDVRRATMRARHDDDSAVRESAPGMTGQRLLLALLTSDDTVVGAVLATATDLDGLRARVETAVTPAPAA